MMIEKIYVPNVPLVERRTVIGTITERAVDLDVHDHSKKNSRQELTQQNKEEEPAEQHPAPSPENAEKPNRIDVVA